MLLDRGCSRLKIIDFGLSRKMKDGTEVRELLGTPEFVGEILSSSSRWYFQFGHLTYGLLHCTLIVLGEGANTGM